MTLKFKNGFGEFTLSGSGKEDASICEIEGLELGTKQRNLNQYIGEDGVFESSSQYIQRVITISGDIKINEDYHKRVQNIARILSDKCTLYIENKEINRKITVNAATLSFGKRNSAYQTYVIQLTCDYPHFEDVEETVIYIFRKEKLLSKESTLPCMLCQRISEGEIINEGDLKIYPKIVKTKLDDNIAQRNIKIMNLSLGKELILNKSMVRGEEIVIDIKNRMITSSIEGNILKTLDLYSSLSDMWCDVGENIITVTVAGAQTGVDIKAYYHNEYPEAI